ILIVFSIVDVFEEAVDDRGWNDVAGVVGLAQSLEGDADDLVALDDWATRIAGVDRGIDLNGEVGIGSAVGVGLKVDARDHTTGDRNSIAADRIANHANF
ncbi:MAG: hypothetical protein RLY69_1233, partial [Verrucomicrobiota bacterium]